MVGNARGVIFSLLFAGNVERLYVAAQPKEGGMPHLALTRPLGEFYLAYRRALPSYINVIGFGPRM